MTCGAFQLLFGKLYTFYSAKSVLFTSILLFEIGSAICGAAPNSATLIVGRAFAGVGAAGILAGSVSGIIFAHETTSQRVANAINAGHDRCLLRPSEEASGGARCSGCLLRPCNHPGPFNRRCIYHSCHMEMVLLHQFAHWWSCHDHCCGFPENSQTRVNKTPMEGQGFGPRSPGYLVPCA